MVLVLLNVFILILSGKENNFDFKFCIAWFSKSCPDWYRQTVKWKFSLSFFFVRGSKRVIFTSVHKKLSVEKYNIKSRKYINNIIYTILFLIIKYKISLFRNKMISKSLKPLVEQKLFQIFLCFSKTVEILKIVQKFEA
jgi:hypothetical protein